MTSLNNRNISSGAEPDFLSSHPSTSAPSSSSTQETSGNTISTPFFPSGSVRIISSVSNPSSQSVTPTVIPSQINSTTQVQNPPIQIHSSAPISNQHIHVLPSHYNTISSTPIPHSEDRGFSSQQNVQKRDVRYVNSPQNSLGNFGPSSTPVSGLSGNPPNINNPNLPSNQNSKNVTSRGMIREVKVPNSSNWFEIDRIHEIERQAFPDFFDGKFFSKTPEM
eukprot:TRINITY_DN1666_c0_g3_i2.p1 TRINITY_DN1666_c0_g3~~TRINITY_DN1666_c0_g3_i2.p1  ORF type:complete len:222 (+),score=52.79 TRINITY_DN1666_c0_g3_i2:54-719(+)